MRILLTGLLLLSPSAVVQAQMRAVVPASAPAAANRVYSPGVDTGDYVYVSATGPSSPRWQLARNFRSTGPAGSG